MTIDVTSFGNGSFKIAAESRALLINPVNLPPQNSHADYIFITHWQQPLWDNALKLAHETGAILVMTEALADWLKHQPAGLNIPPVTVISRDAELLLPSAETEAGISVVVTDCEYNYYLPNEPAPYRANGYVFKAGGHSIFYAGPTAMFPGLRDIGKLYNPNVAVLPVGAAQFLSGESLCHSILWLGADIILPMILEEKILEDNLAETEIDVDEIYVTVDMYTPAICRILSAGDTYSLPLVESTGRISGPEARY